MSTDPGGDMDAERRFGGLRRLYGPEGYQRLRGLHVAVVGLGGVGSWAVEALARSGVAALTLVDLDHVAASNINRQVQATTQTLGQHKGEALRERIRSIHPACAVRVVVQRRQRRGTDHHAGSISGAPRGLSLSGARACRLGSSVPRRELRCVINPPLRDRRADAATSPRSDPARVRL